jgi:glycosyltransferase involved in cell wall biosynthesis
MGHERLVWTVHGPWEKPAGTRARVMARHLRRVVAVSGDVARHCRFPERMMVTIPLGAMHALAAVPRRRPAPLPGSPVTIGVLGRLQRVKGQDLAVRALERVAAAHPGRAVSLRIGGEADPRSSRDCRYAERLRSAARDAVGHRPNLDIRFEGFVDDVQAFLADLDILLVPSRYESFGMVTVEALARGVPVVVPDCGGPAEIVDDASIGLRFRPADVSDMAEQLARAIELEFDPGRAVSRSRDFSIERQRDAHLALYDSILGEGKSS